MAPKSKTKDVSVAARITVDQAQRLDEVQLVEPVLSSRSAAIGRLIDMMTGEDLEAFDAAAGKENDSRNVCRDIDVGKILAALEERTRAYNEVSKHLRAIGNNLNQLVRLGHQVALYGKSGGIAAKAIEGIARQLENALVNGLHRLAAQDAHIEKVLRACRP